MRKLEGESNKIKILTAKSWRRKNFSWAKRKH